MKPETNNGWIPRSKNIPSCTYIFLYFSSDFRTNFLRGIQARIAKLFLKNKIKNKSPDSLHATHVTGRVIISSWGLQYGSFPLSVPTLPPCDRHCPLTDKKVNQRGPQRNPHRLLRSYKGNIMTSQHQRQQKDGSAVANNYYQCINVFNIPYFSHHKMHLTIRLHPLSATVTMIKIMNSKNVSSQLDTEIIKIKKIDKTFSHFIQN